MASCETCKCPFCGRRAVPVDHRTGNRKQHRKRAGRKGPQCPGSNRHRNTQPEPPNGPPITGAYVDEITLLPEVLWQQRDLDELTT